MAWGEHAVAFQFVVDAFFADAELPGGDNLVPATGGKRLLQRQLFNFNKRHAGQANGLGTCLTGRCREFDVGGMNCFLFTMERDGPLEHVLHLANISRP